MTNNLEQLKKGINYLKNKDYLNAENISPQINLFIITFKMLVKG